MRKEDKSRSLEEVQAEIEKIQAELKDVHGTETEVYARIVGYYRAVKNWNKGKKDEFELRKTFDIENYSDSEAKADSEKSSTTVPPQAKVKLARSIVRVKNKCLAFIALF